LFDLSEIKDFAMLKSLILDSKSNKMKQLFFVILITAFISGCAGKSTVSTDATQAVAGAANKTVTLAIEGMTCTGCENTIQEAVTKVPGVAEIKASHLDSTAVVSFDTTKTYISAIGDAINEAGYVYIGEKKSSVQVQPK
jgi:periplasmic mercuric ion binding protein